MNEGMNEPNSSVFGVRCSVTISLFMNIVISVVRIKCYSSEGVANRGGVEFKMAIEEMSLARVVRV